MTPLDRAAGPLARWPFRGAATSDPQRLVVVLLGLVWIADGLLQCQPSMFGRGLVTGVLLPTAKGNPGPVAGSITAMAQFLEPHIAAWDAVFAATQLAIGAGLLMRRTLRPALVASFAWSALVWWFAEGLGGLLTGAASPLTGAPGAVFLYVLVGLLAWPRAAQPQGSGATGATGLLGERGAKAAWAALWVGSAALLLQPANLAPGALPGALRATAAGQPRWYAGLLVGAARALGPYGLPLTIAIATEMAIVGLGVALGWQVAPLLGVATVLALSIWALPEGLGGILTGTGTDPNTGPLLALAALAWCRARPEPPFGRSTGIPAVCASAVDSRCEEHGRGRREGTAQEGERWPLIKTAPRAR